MTGALEQTFTVPATGGQHATEVLYLSGDGTVNGLGADMRINEISIALPDIVTDAEVEIDLLKPNGDRNDSNDWYLAMRSFDAVGLQNLVQLAGWVGVRIRVRSGGTAGTQTVGVSWR